MNLPPADWLSSELYPFTSRLFTTPRDKSLHYIDEGHGQTVLFVHGNPSWSFEFRNVIKSLRKTHRCVAIDHIGFGLSEHTTNPADHTPQQHADNLAAFIVEKDLRDITLFLNDWGGPIGLDIARRYPDRISRIALSNTWCWSVAKEFHYQSFSWLMSSRLGQYLIKERNIFVEKILPMACGNKKSLTEAVMNHYRNAQPAQRRHANAALPGHIIDASSWLESIWNDRELFIHKPSCVLWGMKDIAFRKQELRVWEDTLTNTTIHTFPTYGHLLPEEAPDMVVSKLRELLNTPI